MLDSLFSDDGNHRWQRIEENKMKDEYRYAKPAEQPDIKYLQYTKDEYLKNKRRNSKRKQICF